MKIQFKEYHAKIGILKFAVTGFFSSNHTWSFQKKFFTRVKLTLSFDVNIQQNTYTISPLLKNGELILFLKDTKKIFLDNGVSINDWLLFENKVAAAANIQLDQKKMYLDHLPQVLISEIDKYSFFTEKFNLWQTNSFFHKTLGDYKKLLKIHFPDDYKKFETSKKKFNCIKVFHQANNLYQKGIKYDGSHLLSDSKYVLYPLFKIGDLNGIIGTGIFSIKELLLYNDNYYRRWQGLLTWAHINKHPHILNFFFNLFLPQIHEINFNPLEWGIFCYQDVDVLKTLRGPGDLKHEIRLSSQIGIFLGGCSNFDALSLAGFCGHTKAVEYLFSESSFKSKSDCAFYAALNDRLDIIQYIYHIQPSFYSFITDNPITTGRYIPMQNIRYHCAMYLISQPDFLFMFIQQYPYVETIYSNEFYSPVLYYLSSNTEPQIIDYVTDKIHQWLSTQDSIFEPLQTYYKQNMAIVRQTFSLTIALTFECLLTNMLINLPHRDPSKIANILERCMKVPTDKTAFIEVLKRIKDDMLALTIPEESVTKKLKR